MLLVSIIIPNYNYGKFLRKAVESLVQQSYKRIELIIVDDGSSDNSRETIESLKGIFQDRFERFVSLLLKQNRGTNYAINKGLTLVHGKITVILDADDYLENSYIEETVERLLENNKINKKIAFVYTDCWLVDSIGNKLAKGKSTSFDKKLLQTSSYIPTCAPTFTSVFQRVMPFEKNIRVATKHHRWRRIVNAGWEGLYLEKPLFYYRMHDQNLSGIGKKLLQDVDRTNPKMHILSGHWLTTNFMK